MAATLCECPLCHATFQATPEMAGTAVQCPACARPLQLPAKLGIGGTRVCQAIRIDVCTCPDCSQGFGYTTQMLETMVACPHCSASFRLRADGNLVRSAGPVVQPGNQPSPPSPPAPRKKPRFREADQTGSVSPAKPTEKPTLPAPAADSTVRIVTGDRDRTLADAIPPIQVKPARPGERNAEPGREETAKEAAKEAAKPSPTQPSRVRPVPVTRDSAVKTPMTPAAKAPPGHSSPIDGTESRNPTKAAWPLTGSPAVSEAAADSPDQPPKFSGEKPAPQPAGSQLLPPKFYSSDPTIIRQRRASRGEQPFVLLPDSKGGFQRVNNTVIRIQHEGETIVLAAPDPKRVRQRRLIVNLITLAICLAILYFVFRSLLQ